MARMRYRVVVPALLLLCSPVAVAQTAGIMLVHAPSITNFANPFTLIDTAHPVTADGTLQTVYVHWNGNACNNAIKVKVLRPNPPFVYGGTFDVVANIGPYNVQPGTNALGFPTNVKKGDLLALSQLSSACTGVALGRTNPGDTLPVLFKDVNAADTLSGASYFSGTSMSLFASNVQTNLAAVIPVAGAVQGGFGSFFRTSLQIANTDAVANSLELVYHPQAASGPDISMLLNVPAGGTVSYDDIISTMHASGVGSLDIVTTKGIQPLIKARVYNDGGANGTSGFTEDAYTPGEFLHAGDSVLLITPIDLAKSRMNVGVRTLTATQLQITYGSSAGFTRDYAANYFVQSSLADFVATAPAVNTTFRVRVVSGDAIVYASTTDNTTNDSAADFPRRR